jgi:hypothetical protein
LQLMRRRYGLAERGRYLIEFFSATFS